MNYLVTLRPGDDGLPAGLRCFRSTRFGNLEEELGTSLDKSRFRANIYLDLKSGRGFEEDTLVGRTLRVGAKTTIALLERDPRCKMITLDPGHRAAEYRGHEAIGSPP